MNKEERHKLILENLISAESIQVAELASLLSVSTVTIRKDLTELEDEPYGDNSDRLATALAKAMTVLTPRQRQVFDLRHYDGMSFADISAIAGMAEDTARATFHQSRAKLRDILQSMDIHP